MDYKIVAVDMDGTLLNSQGEVSDRNKKALKVATEKGVQVVISTGRIFTSARYYAKLLGLITPIIACNGAYVSEYHRNNVIIEDALQLIDLKKVIEVAERNHVHYHFYDNHKFYASKENERAREFYNWNKKQTQGDRIEIEMIEDPIRLIEKEKPSIYKLVILDDDRNKLNKVNTLLSKIKNIEVVSSWNNNIEVMNKGVSKGNALKKLCQLMSINRNKVIAIGDNYNDLSMLEFAGMPVAMGNGEEEVKASAKMITDTNDGDGVAKALEELVF